MLVSYLKKILHTLSIIAVALSADSLHLFDLSSFTGCLDVLEMDLWILTEVHNGAKEIEKTCKTHIWSH